METIKLTPVTDERNNVIGYTILLNAHMSNVMIALASMSDADIAEMFKVSPNHTKAVLQVLLEQRMWMRKLARMCVKNEELFYLYLTDARRLSSEGYTVESLNLEYAFTEYNLENTLNLFKLLSLSSFVVAIANAAICKSIGSHFSKEEKVKMN
jgi:hypothetical protein